jgi:hypothetical protein
MPSSPNTPGTTTGYYELGPASRHRNAIQVNSPLAAAIQHDQDRRLAGLLHYGPQFPGKLVLIGNDVPGSVAWRQDSDSGSGGYGLCHGLAVGGPCFLAFLRERQLVKAMRQGPRLKLKMRVFVTLTPQASRQRRQP